MGGFGEVGEGFAEGAWVWSLEDHEGHAWAEEHDVGGLVFGEEFVLEVSAVAGNQCRGFWVVDSVVARDLLLPE